MTKILIYVEGGNIQMVAASKKIDLVVVDRDNQDAGDDPVANNYPYEIKKPGTFKELFPFQDNSDRKVYEELDRLNF